MGCNSIPIARSIDPDDSGDLARLSYLNPTQRRLVLDGVWTVLHSIRRLVVKDTHRFILADCVLLSD